MEPQTIPSLVFFWGIAASAACGSSGVGEQAVLAPNERLLFEPHGAPERLLGRQVTFTDDGAVIADALAPGCEVTVKPEQRDTTHKYHQRLSQMGGLKVGYPDYMGLHAQYGASSEVELVFHQTKILYADLRGTCGNTVVMRVKVGTGHRYVRKNRGGKLELSSTTVLPVSVDAPNISEQTRMDIVAERSEQGWIFAFGNGTTASDDITIIMPPRIRHGEAFTPQIEVRRDMYLIVLYEDANGNYGVVTPHADPRFAVTRVRGGTTVALPSFASKLPEGYSGRTAHEALLVYGFPEEGDFASLRPPRGALTAAQYNEYARTLQEVKLKDLPAKRWAFTRFDFDIEPNK